MATEKAAKQGWVQDLCIGMNLTREKTLLTSSIQ